MVSLIVDAHEDIATNGVLLGRDFRQDIAKLREQFSGAKDGTPMVCLPELKRGNVRLVFATIWAGPCGTSDIADRNCYETAEEAHAIGVEQLNYYKGLERDAGLIRIIKTKSELEDHISSDDEKVGFVILMEGADPIRTTNELREWCDDGVRIVGPAWKKTRYAGGTGSPGPLSSEGLELIKEMDSLGMILDTSHLAEQSFFEALDIFHGSAIASHSNCRALVPTDRQLSDEMIRALVSRGGVIGTVLCNQFLDSGWVKRGKIKADVKMHTVLKHVNHVCEIAGDRLHSAIGSDFDGGFGVESTPAEFDTVADLEKMGPALKNAGFSEEEVSNILGGNWIRLLEKALP